MKTLCLNYSVQGIINFPSKARPAGLIGTRSASVKRLRVKRQVPRSLHLRGLAVLVLALVLGLTLSVCGDYTGGHGYYGVKIFAQAAIGDGQPRNLDLEDTNSWDHEYFVPTVSDFASTP